MNEGRFSRRDFLRTTGLATLWLAGGCRKHEAHVTSAPKPFVPAPAHKVKPVVAAITDAAAVDENWKILPARVERMVNEAVMLLTKAPTPETAWAALFPGVKSTDVAGIKVNTLNPLCPSHIEVAMAVAAGLQKAGFRENNIIIWDRAEGSFIEGLTLSGYAINRGASGVRVLGTNSPSVGYDPRNLVTIPSIQKTMAVSKLVSQACQYLVNIPVLKEHGITGMTGCHKSYYGAIPLGDRVSLMDIGLVHQNNGDPQIAELYANAIIREKTRLHIADGLMGIYKSGPHGKPQWRNGQIFASRDPVALDYQLLQILDTMRAQNRQGPITAKARHILSAEKLGLGACMAEVRSKKVTSDQ